MLNQAIALSDDYYRPLPFSTHECLYQGKLLRSALWGGLVGKAALGRQAVLKFLLAFRVNSTNYDAHFIWPLPWGFLFTNLVVNMNWLI